MGGGPFQGGGGGPSGMRGGTKITRGGGGGEPIENEAGSLKGALFRAEKVPQGTISKGGRNQILHRVSYGQKVFSFAG